MKRKLFTLFALLCATAAWAQTNVGNNTELRNAITNGANIKLTVDINHSNSTLSIAEGMTVTIDLGGHTLDRKLTQRGEYGGQVFTVRKGVTLNLTGGTLKGGWGGDGIDSDANHADGVWYDLSERKVNSKSAKGIYIVNGKKC